MLSRQTKQFLLSIRYLPLLLYVISCSPPDENGQEYERWTSADPLALQLRVRLQNYQQGNLVLNSSFETGKTRQYDTLTSAIQVDAWDIIGGNVSWISLKSDSSKHDSNLVHSGQGSIHINRTSASETESMGEGVLSDYIKTIPGNYEFTAYLKLTNVHSPKSELGTRLYDAVNIKVLCYDRNKVLISGKQYAPHHGSFINNSFKCSSLSKFAFIDSTGWIHVHGKTREFPYQDGDLQDDTKFVRLFIGLKGNGSMLIDDVDFHYTESNFTAIERIKPYFDTTLTKQALIVPEPKELEIIGSVTYYRPYYEDNFPIIVIPTNADIVTLKAAELLEQKIKELLQKHSELQVENIPSLIRRSVQPFELGGALIFSLGKTFLSDRNIDKMPYQKIKGKEQGYFIHNLSDQNHIVFLDANNSGGILYAVQSCIQLFDKNKLLFHNVNVVDYPTIENYSLLLLDYLESERSYVSENLSHRFSSIYLPGTSATALRSMFSKSAFKKKLYIESDKTSENEIRSLANRYKPYIGGLCLIEGNLDCPLSADLAKNNVDIAFREDNLLTTSLLKNLSYQYGTGALEVLPNSGDNFSLLTALNSPSKVECFHTRKGYSNVWCAYKFQTWKLDEADLMFYEQNAGEVSVFMDFSLLPHSEVFDFFAYDSIWPYKLLSASLVEPYNNQIAPEIYTNLKKHIVAYKVSNVFDKIRIQTASDYFWDPEKYNPELSLYRALVHEFGEETAWHVIQFNHGYFKLKSEIILAGTHDGANKYIRRIASFFKEIKETEQRIMSSDCSEELQYEVLKRIKEIEDLIDRNNIVLITQ